LLTGLARGVVLGEAVLSPALSPTNMFVPQFPREAEHGQRREPTHEFGDALVAEGQPEPDHEREGEEPVDEGTPVPPHES
jgi:hypothetical protein